MSLVASVTVRIHDRTDRAQHLYLHLQQHKLATLLGCWLCAPVSLQATVIVALLHPDAVYIAADSKKTTTDGSNAVTGVSTICKIQVVNGILYAAAGLDSFNTIFDLRAVITVALRTEGPGLSNKLALLDRNLREALATPVEEIGLSGESMGNWRAQR